MLCAVVALAMVALPMSAHATYPGGKGNISFLDNESDRGNAGETDLRLITPTGKFVDAAIQHCGYDQNEDPSSAMGCPRSR